MHILNSKRVWIDRPITIGGVLYPHLYDDALRASLGVVEVPDPAQPGDYSPDAYSREDIEDAPYVVYTPIAPQSKTIFSALEYLDKFTDAEYQAARTGTMRAQRALDMLIAYQFVDIENDPRVPAALDIMIEDCGMTSERKDELLTPEIVL